MANRIVRKGLLASGSALRGLALVGTGLGAVAALAPTAAYAQDYTSGAVTGTVTDANGAPVSGATVTIRSQAQNQTRTVTTNSAGNFSAVGLVPGEYDLSIEAGGMEPYTNTFTVRPALESRLGIGMQPQGSTIVVSGSFIREDFTKTTTGLNIDVPELVSQIAVPRSVTALVLLAPGTARGVPGFGDVASIGGSSVAENAYYVNGLNITNPDTYVGGADVPFDFYKNVDVQTGGYAAEFGRATGGIINATTKSGGNDWTMGIHGNFALEELQSDANNVGDPTNPGTIGALTRDNVSSLSLEAGGPIIKDHVFIYGLIQNNMIRRGRANGAGGTYTHIRSDDPFWGVKADVFLTPTQHAEFTYFNTEQDTYYDYFDFTVNSAFNGGTIGALSDIERFQTGGENWVARYTGEVTDFFTLSAAYGVNKDVNNAFPTDPTAYLVVDRRSVITGGTPIVVSTQQSGGQDVIDTQRKFWRVDGDLRFDAMGRHHVRFGVDNEDLSQTKTSGFNGAFPIFYRYSNAGVQIIYQQLGGQMSAKNRSYYLQDSWDVTDGLTINLGVRNDEFQQYNLSGERYANFKNNWALRAGFSFIPNGGDSNWKFTGSYGRYFIPPAMNLGFRGKDTYFAEYFRYPAGTTVATFTYDPVTGLPTMPLGPARTDLGASGYSGNCPVDFSGAPGNPVNAPGACLILGAGVQDPALAKLARDAKATYEDEFILGAQYQLTDLFTVALTGTLRKLGRVSEDTDFHKYLYNYYKCGTAGQTASAAKCDFYDNNSTYYIWNVGQTANLNDWYDALSGVVTPVTLTGLPFPTPKRTYKALSLSWKRADDGKWFWQGSVTWSSLRGNTEGTVKSDAGNGAQVDAGSTQDFDYPGLADNSFGTLSNNHTWTFKSQASYHITEAFSVGANVLVQSPTAGSCFGLHPTDSDAAGYGASSYFCGINPYTTAGTGSPAFEDNVASPRGSGLKTDWLTQVDLSLRYTLWDHITLRADVFNLFNAGSVITRDNVQQTGQVPASDDPRGGFYANELYGLPRSYQTPRYVRLGFDITF